MAEDKIMALAHRVIDYTVQLAKLNLAPENCRNRLKQEGCSYPKSGCDYCKKGGLTGCPFGVSVEFDIIAKPELK